MTISSSLMGIKTAKKTGHKRRGGWPKRDLVPVVLRIPPDLAKFLAELAAGSRVRSRSALIEAWLEALRSVVAAVTREEGRLPPDQVVDALALGLVRELDHLGVKVPGICYGWTDRGMTVVQGDVRKLNPIELDEAVEQMMERRNERKGQK